MSHYIPQFIIGFLLALPVGASLYKWTIKQIKFTELFAVLLKFATFIGLLCWGGFFK